MQRDLEGTWEKCRHVLANAEMGALDPVGELGGSLPLTFEGQPTDPHSGQCGLEAALQEGCGVK